MKVELAGNPGTVSTTDESPLLGARSAIVARSACFFPAALRPAPGWKFYSSAVAAVIVAIAGACLLYTGHLRTRIDEDLDSPTGASQHLALNTLIKTTKVGTYMGVGIGGFLTIAIFCFSAAAANNDKLLSVLAFTLFGIPTMGVMLGAASGAVPAAYAEMVKHKAPEDKTDAAVFAMISTPLLVFCLTHLLLRLMAWVGAQGCCQPKVTLSGPTSGAHEALGAEDATAARRPGSSLV